MIKKLKLLLFVLYPIWCYGPEHPVKKEFYEPIEKTAENLFWLYEKHNIKRDFTPKLFYEYLVRLGAKDPEAVFRLAILESGHFKSGLFTKYNNPFGMKMPRCRDTYATGTNPLNHASYDHWTDAVKDFILWEEYMVEKLGGYDSEAGYIAFLNDIGYAEDPYHGIKIKTLNIKRYGIHDSSLLKKTSEEVRC